MNWLDDNLFWSTLTNMTYLCSIILRVLGLVLGATIMCIFE